MSLTVQPEDFIYCDPHGLQANRITANYANGATVQIDVGRRITVSYNTGDILVYVCRDDKYVMDLIATHDGLMITIAHQ